MRDPNRIHETMELLEEMWNKFPDWRFMQLINNIQRAYGSDMFYVEDDKFNEHIKEYIATIEPPKRKRIGEINESINQSRLWRWLVYLEPAQRNRNRQGFN